MFKVTATDMKRCEELLAILGATSLTVEGHEVIKVAQALLWLKELETRFSVAVADTKKEDMRLAIMEEIKAQAPAVKPAGKPSKK